MPLVLTLSLDDVAAAFQHKQYHLKIRPYEFNVFGVRASGGATNTFNDALGVYYLDYGHSPCLQYWPATTDPGFFYLEHPENVNGTAIVVPGQYADSHIVGKHHGQYRALVQNTSIKVYRDNNKDDTYDMNPKSIQGGIFGINIHHAGAHSTQVADWSAGCQVFANLDDFNVFMLLVDQNIAEGYGEIFTYTLFDEADLSAH